MAQGEKVCCEGDGIGRWYRAMVCPYEAVRVSCVPYFDRVVELKRGCVKSNERRVGVHGIAAIGDVAEER